MNTSPIQRILVPTDLSEFSDLALDYALLFQKKLGAQITLLYAEEFTLLTSGEYYYADDAAHMKKRASRLLHEYITKHVPSTSPVATMLVDDIPGRAIVMTADDVNADLIIMGSHGRHGLRRALLGSVTERVLRETTRPVMTVVPKIRPVDSETKIATILCPVNFTDVAREALENACALAGALEAQVIVMHVVEREDDTTPANVETRFHSWVDPLVRGRTRYEQVVSAGEPAARVLEVADQVRADLIVLGAQHKLFSDATVIGTTTERVTRFAHQPVLTITRRAAAAAREKPEQLVAVG